MNEDRIRYLVEAKLRRLNMQRLSLEEAVDEFWDELPDEEERREAARQVRLQGARPPWVQR